MDELRNGHRRLKKPKEQPKKTVDSDGRAVISMADVKGKLKVLNHVQVDKLPPKVIPVRPGAHGISNGAALQEMLGKLKKTSSTLAVNSDSPSSSTTMDLKDLADGRKDLRELNVVERVDKTPEQVRYFRKEACDN